RARMLGEVACRGQRALDAEARDGGNGGGGRKASQELTACRHGDLHGARGGLRHDTPEGALGWRADALRRVSLVVHHGAVRESDDGRSDLQAAAGALLGIAELDAVALEARPQET